MTNKVHLQSVYSIRIGMYTKLFWHLYCPQLDFIFINIIVIVNHKNNIFCMCAFNNLLCLQNFFWTSGQMLIKLSKQSCVVLLTI